MRTQRPADGFYAAFVAMRGGGALVPRGKRTRAFSRSIGRQRNPARPERAELRQNLPSAISDRAITIQLALTRDIIPKLPSLRKRGTTERGRGNWELGRAGRRDELSVCSDTWFSAVPYFYPQKMMWLCMDSFLKNGVPKLAVRPQRKENKRTPLTLFQRKCKIPSFSFLEKL